MLRLVHPAPTGQGTDPPKRHKGSRADALSLTDAEAAHFRAALSNARRAYGCMPVLADVMGVPAASLYQVATRHRRPSGAMAIRLAKAAGVSVEAVLGGALAAAGRCPTCGHRAGDGRVAAAGGAP